MSTLRERVGVEPGDDLPSYAWPGGYALVYYTADGSELCAECARMAEREGLSGDPDDPQGNLVGASVYWEGPALQCDHCYKEMPSEYGDPDAEEQD